MMGRSSLLLLAALVSCASPCAAFFHPLAAGLRDSALGGPYFSAPTDKHVSPPTAAMPERPQQHHVRVRRSRHHHPSTTLSMSNSADAATPSSPPPAAEATPAAAFPGPETTVKPGAKISNEWELDVYSRPVVGADGKKLWELLICDSTGNFRHVSPIPSNMVNSREVRKTIEGVIEAAPGGSKPTVIRFFRNAMFNMIDIALKEVEIAVKPCRTTYAMYQWLEERERDVYPAMAGYKPTMRQPAFFDIRVRSEDVYVDVGSCRLTGVPRCCCGKVVYCSPEHQGSSASPCLPQPISFSAACECDEYAVLWRWGA